MANSSYINFSVYFKKHRELNLRFSSVKFFAGVMVAGLGVFFVGWYQSASYFTDRLDKSQKALDGRVERLADAMVRVRGYENQLRIRASLLNDILADVSKLDFRGLDDLELGNNTEKLSRENRVSWVKADSEKEGSKLGVGGGSVSDLFRGKHPLKIVKSDVDVDTLEGRKLLQSFDRQMDRLSTLPLGVPVDGEVSSVFGLRKSPFTGRSQFHTGIDFAVDKKTIVVASGDGVVSISGRLGGYGLAVMVDHGYGVQSLYGHLDKIAVEEGAKVCRGQVIGYLGSTGRSTGPHLHYEIRVEGSARNPQKFIDLAALLQLLG